MGVPIPHKKRKGKVQKTLASFLGAFGYFIGVVPYIFVLSIIVGGILSLMGDTLTTSGGDMSLAVATVYANSAADVLRMTYSLLLIFAALLFATAILAWLPFAAARAMSKALHWLTLWVFGKNYSASQFFLVRAVVVIAPVVNILTLFAVAPSDLTVSLAALAVLSGVSSLVLLAIQTALHGKLKTPAKEIL